MVRDILSSVQMLVDCSICLFAYISCQRWRHSFMHAAKALVGLMKEQRYGHRSMLRGSRAITLTLLYV